MTDPASEADGDAKIEELIARRDGEVEDALRAEPMMRDMLSSLDKWILATLVAINGGAVLGVLSAIGSLGFDPRPSLGAFTIGILLAVWGARTERNSAGELLDAHTALRAEQKSWAEKLRQKDLEAAYKMMIDRDQAAKEHLMLSQFYAKLANYLYRGSIVAFVVGAGIAGFMMEPRSSQPDNFNAAGELAPKSSLKVNQSHQ